MNGMEDEVRDRYARATAAMLLAGLLVGALGHPARAQGRPARGGGTKDAAPARSSYAAERLLKTAQDYLLAREFERAIEMLKKVIQQYPGSFTRYKAYLTLGKHFLDVHKQPEAIGYLKQIRTLKTEAGTADRDAGRLKRLKGQAQDVYLEGMYLLGNAYFELRQFRAAFPVLRAITRDYPNTVWANQAYYFIGMCHFAQESWKKAIDALSLVGTFVDPNSPTVEYAEAGRRFYVKVSDGDLPILRRLGREITVSVETRSGDAETILCVPLSGEGEVFIGSIPTAVAEPRRGDRTLQVVGGDTITSTYIDNNTKDGRYNLPVKKIVKVVSTAAVSLTLGDYDTKAVAAFLGQPLHVMVHDADRDLGRDRDTLEVRFISRYKKPEEDDSAALEDRGVDLEKLLQEEDEKEEYITRDEVRLALHEIGEPPVRSGRFGGKLHVEAARKDVDTADTGDDVLTCAEDDEVVVTYLDEKHIGGEIPREVSATLKVSGEISNIPRARQYEVFEPIIKARKELVESQAYLELGKIFTSMGLKDGARTRLDEGLDRVNDVIRTQAAIPALLKEQAFKLKWELEIETEDFGSAMATCQVFSRHYPHSPLVDSALLGMGRAHASKGRHTEAISVYEQILKLPNSQAKGEAQFRIAEAVEKQATVAAKAGKTGKSGIDVAIPHYKRVVERYPASEYAGNALKKLVKYYIRSKDFTQADDLLRQVFQDYPDAEFLDEMLLHWTLVSYYMGNYRQAHEKAQQLLFEYPTSAHTKKVKSILPRIEGKLM